MQMIQNLNELCLDHHASQKSEQFQLNGCPEQIGSDRITEYWRKKIKIKYDQVLAWTLPDVRI